MAVMHGCEGCRASRMTVRGSGSWHQTRERGREIPTDDRSAGQTVDSQAVSAGGDLNLVTTAYNLTDTFFIGQLGTAQSGAIGIAFSIMTVMQALGFFFGNGAGNSMSRELGKQNNERASRLLAVGFAGAVISGLTIAAIGLLTLRPLVVMLGSTPRLRRTRCNT